MVDKIRKLPRIRFKGFIDDWEQHKLADILKRRQITQLISEDAPRLAFASGQGVIPLSERKTNNRDQLISDETTKKYLLTEIDDIVYNPANLKYGAIDRNKYGKGVISPIYVTFTTQEEPSFVEKIVTTQNFKARALRFEEGSVTKRQSVSPECLLSLDVMISRSKNEQKKIGYFFQNIEYLIDLHEQKLNLLKLAKKSMLQKIFPKDCENAPQVRFVGFTDAWEYRDLGTMGNTFTGLSGKTKEDFGHGEAKFVTYVNVFNNAISDPKRVENVEVDNKQNQVKYGDVFFTTSSETPEDVGMSSVWLQSSENVYLNSFCFGYRPVMELDVYYLAFMLRSPEVRKKFMLLAQGISRYNISKNKVMEMRVPVPDFNEQKKVGAFLKNLDNLIINHQNELNLLKDLKKSMVQQMFI